LRATIAAILARPTNAMRRIMFAILDHDYNNLKLSPEFIEALRAAFKAAGWEGDGRLGALLVPPFFGSEGLRDWFPVFHAKQSNNGISWIASEQTLSVADLLGPISY
jgi:hypothetical protein